jgi:hypothetical protein
LRTGHWPLHKAREPAGDDFFGFSDDPLDQVGHGRDVMNEPLGYAGGPDPGVGVTGFINGAPALARYEVTDVVKRRALSQQFGDLHADLVTGHS